MTATPIDPAEFRCPPQLREQWRRKAKVRSEFLAKFGDSPILTRFTTPEDQLAMMISSLQTGKVHPGLVFSIPGVRID